MNTASLLGAAAMAALLGLPAQAQTGSVRVYTCDTTVTQQAVLRVEDQTADSGATLEDPALITLPNGMKSVQFAVRHTGQYLKRNSILKVRYTVNWTDDCGRRLMSGTNTVDGVILNPSQYQVIQSTAMHPDATHATLRVYVDN